MRKNRKQKELTNRKISQQQNLNGGQKENKGKDKNGKRIC